MNKKKLEKLINKSVNVNPNFENIKNKIYFDKYTNENFEVRKPLNFSWWKIISPICGIIIILLFMFNYYVPFGYNSQQSTSSSSTQNNDEVASSSQCASSSSISNKDNSLQFSAESSSSLEHIPGDMSSQSSTKEENMPNVSNDFSELKDYTNQNGYFKNSTYESEASVCYQTHALFNTESDYNINQKINIDIFIGTYCNDEEGFDTSIIMYDYRNSEAAPIVLYEINNFDYENYAIKNILVSEDLSYSFFQTKVSIVLDLSLITSLSGEIYIGLNYTENNTNYDRGVEGDTFYFLKTNERIKFSKNKII